MAAGVWLLILEMGLLASWRKGPFKSMANLEKFIDASKNVIAFIRAANYNDILWETFYPDIAKQLDMWWGEWFDKRWTQDRLFKLSIIGGTLLPTPLASPLK